MAIPDFQTLMLPALRAAADGAEHSVSALAQVVADEFKLSEAERKEVLPSGRQKRFNNRVGWAVTYLRKTGLLANPRRGIVVLSPRGREVLKEKPERIDLKYLERFPELEEFRNLRHTDEEGEPAATQPAPEGNETPEEALESHYSELRDKLAGEVIAKVKSCSPAFFERLVVDLLVRMGYGGSLKDAGKAVGQSSDGGIDGIIKEDKLGLDAVYIQAKRWEAKVGRPIVQAFAGSLEGQRARKGVLITTSSFSDDAKDYVGRIEKKIVLIDGRQLAELMMDHGVGVADVVTYTVKRMDLDYFEVGEELEP